MFGIGFSELLIIGIVALLVLGPERLPEAAKTCGKLLATLRKQQQNLKQAFDEELKNPLNTAINDIDNNLNSENSPTNKFNDNSKNDLANELNEFNDKSSVSNSVDDVSDNPIDKNTDKSKPNDLSPKNPSNL